MPSWLRLLPQRSIRCLRLLWCVRPLRLALTLIRHHACASALSVLSRGATLQTSDHTVTFSYLGYTIDLPLPALFKLNVIADMLDRGSSLYRVGDARWKLTIPDGAAFIIGGESLVSDVSAIHDCFFAREYDYFDVAGAIVLDIGANIGDSAMLFALRVAKAVYAFEPFGPTYLQARANIEASQLTEKVTLFHAGVSSTSGERVGVYNPSHSLGARIAGTPTDHRPGVSTPESRLETVTTVTFAQAISMCAAGHGDVIACKMDCEGCEFEIFRQGAVLQANLQRVDRFLIEFHDLQPDCIIEALESAGFAVEVKKGGKRGHLYAIRA